MRKEKILRAFDQFREQTILVIGDVILDAYYKGKVSRISPEAPVPVLDVTSKEYRLGGAANVALNIHGLNAKPILCAVIGNDFGSKKVIHSLTEHGLSTEGILHSEARVTGVKTRMMSDHSHLLRLDEEQTDLLNDRDRKELETTILTLINKHSPKAIIFEDYDKGLICEELISKVIKLAKEKSIPVTVDPKKRNFFHYKGATLFKPNMRELREGLAIQNLSSSKEDLEEAFKALNDRMKVDMAFFTLSADGVFITDGKDSRAIAAHKRNIADVSGAGDTVISVATCALAANLPMEEIAYLSNLAGGYVCQYPGVVAINAIELKKEFLKTIED